MTDTPWSHLTPEHVGLARLMFDRQVASYGADPEEANLAWMAEGVRNFWLHEAWACLVYIADLEEG